MSPCLYLKTILQATFRIRELIVVNQPPQTRRARPIIPNSSHCRPAYKDNTSQTSLAYSTQPNCQQLLPSFQVQVRISSMPKSFRNNRLYLALLVEKLPRSQVSPSNTFEGCLISSTMSIRRSCQQFFLKLKSRAKLSIFSSWLLTLSESLGRDFF